VVATVEQFNAVSFRVLSTVLMEPDAKSSSRAKVIGKWIDIAQVGGTHVRRPHTTWSTYKFLARFIDYVTFLPHLFKADATQRAEIAI